MKYVYVQNNVVYQIIPEETTDPDIAFWYGKEFESHCVEAPDEVQQRWVYDPLTNTFSEPSEEESFPESESPLDEKVKELEEKVAELEESFDILTEGLA